MEDLRPGDPSAIGPYRLLARLGAGGMGQVFLGRSPSGRMVAVKVVQRELAEDPEFRRRFRAEAEAARRVSGPWTAPVLDSDTESAFPWIATGYVVGPPLREVVDVLHGPLPENSVWALALGLAEALKEIHASGLIHRDLKPSNVMVTLEGPKVIDFGIARAVDASMVTRTGAMVGSPGYSSPEQIRGEAMSGAADVFALGAVLAFAATGRDPFSGDGAQLHTVLYRVMNEKPELGPPEGPLRGGLRELAERCMAKNPGARPGVEEVSALATVGAGTEFWLPPGLTARLGRDAADLLAFDGPGLSQQPAPPAPGAPTIPPTYPPYAPLSAQPAGAASGAPSGGMAGTPGSGGQGPWGIGESGQATPPGLSSVPTAPPSRTTRRGAVAAAVAAGAVATAVIATLIVMNMGGGDENEQAGDSDGGTTAGAAEGAEGGSGEDAAGGSGEGAEGGTGAIDPDAPLADLVPQAVRDAGTITVHASTQADPVLFVEDGDSTLVGFEIDLVREIGELLGVEMTFSETSETEAAAEAAVREGEEVAAHIAVAGFSDDSSSRHELGVDFVNHFGDGLGVMSLDEENTGDLAELCGLTVTTYADEFMEERVRSNTEDCPDPVEIMPFGSRDDMAEAIRTGEADAALLLYSQAAYYAGEHPEFGLNVRMDSAERGPRGIAVPSGQDELRDAIREALGALLEDGTYGELIERWHIPDAAVDTAEVNVGG
ncbi:serine/threonine-protein kinase [Streptomyces sp. SBT349]|uniref:serine/threonine-protein kinase n=1 Tax=Streptomyces sp. SBT349 TaxID=1580539 RepID=UPI00069D7144|nr:serine/threonine-protein kinase [Streptomyces sp. SBT349]